MHSPDLKDLLRALIFSLLGVLLTVSCSRQQVGPKLASPAIAREMGFGKCEVSAPMNRDEVLDFSDKLGNPNLATSPEWAKAISLMQAGDQIRRVYCLKGGENFFGVFRGSSVLFKFGGMLYN